LGPGSNLDPARRFASDAVIGDLRDALRNEGSAF
jgi:hypothetical protein